MPEFGAQVTKNMVTRVGLGKQKCAEAEGLEGGYSDGKGCKGQR